MNTFPVLAGQGIAVHKLPKWNTDVAAHATGRESRAQHYRWPMWDFELTFEGLDATTSGYYGSLGAATMQQLASFFNQQEGAELPFLYVDPTDHTVVGQTIGVGDGSTAIFAMVRSIGPFTGPVDVVTSVTAIYVNGVAQASGFSVANGYPYPALTFVSAPSAGVAITADFSYAYLVRFSDDVEDVEEFMSHLAALKQLKFQSVRIRDDATVYPIVPTGTTYNVWVIDDCCHIFAATAPFASWAETLSPVGTVTDLWTDFAMGINDGDYATLVTVDSACGEALSGQLVGAVQICTPATYPTAPLIFYSPGSPPTAASPQLGAASAATTGGGQKILVTVCYDDSSVFSPRLSTDYGATWSALTGGLPTGTAWIGAAFSANAAVMYLHQNGGQLWKSANGGTTWSLLSTSPTVPVYGLSNPENEYRIRCSQNGSIVAILDMWNGFIWVSTDGGATWLFKDTSFDDFYATDLGMTPSGDKIFYAANAGHPNRVGGFVSTDHGATWTQVLDRVPGGGQLEANQMVGNMSPDGNAFALFYKIAFIVGGGFVRNGGATISIDGGSTWTDYQFVLDDLGGGPAGGFVSCYIVPG